MSINPSNLLKRIKRRLGTPIRVIPFDDNEIMNIVYDETLPIFSSYYPYFVNKKITANKCLVEGEKGIYRIELEEDLEILGISRVLRSTFYHNYGPVVPFSSGGLANSQIIADLRSGTENPLSFRFYPPNKVEVFPKMIYNTDLLVTCKCIHPTHLQTIEMKYFDIFYQLAEYDVKIAIWAVLQNVNDINTAFGTINLALDEFASAADKRQELLEKFDMNFLREEGRKKLWFV